MEKREGGFIKLIIILVIAFAALKIFTGFDIIDVFEGEWFSNAFDAVWNFIKTVWYSYIIGPLERLIGSIRS